jgi:quercetin dioxygenase-like cupin family protein
VSTPAVPKATAYSWNNVTHEQVKPDLGRRLITGSQIMLAQVDLKRGWLVPEHAHVHEQITHVLSGCCA